MKRSYLIVVAALIGITGLVYFYNGVREVPEDYTRELESKIEHKSERVIIQDDSETINDLLRHVSLAEEVVEKYPFTTSDEVINFWADGIINRNGVMQYTAMDDKLRSGFKDYLSSRDNISWVTGSDEFRIDSYEIFERKAISDTMVIYKLKFISGDIQTTGEFTVSFNGKRWGLTSIAMANV